MQKNPDYPQPSTLTQQRTLAVLIIVTSTLTVFCSIAFIYSCFFKIRKKKFELFMIFMIIMGDLINALAIGIPVIVNWNMTYDPEYYNSIPCGAQAFFRQLGILFQCFWTLNLGITAYTKFNGYRNHTTMKLMIGLFGPLILSFTPVILTLAGQNAYGPSEVPILSEHRYIQLNSSLCFLQTGVLYTIEDNLLLLLTFEIPIILILLMVVGFYFIILSKIQKDFYSSEDNIFYVKMKTYKFNLLITQTWFMVIIIVNMFIVVGAYNYQIFCYTMSNLSGILDYIAFVTLYNEQDLASTNAESGIQMESSVK